MGSWKLWPPVQFLISAFLIGGWVYLTPSPEYMSPDGSPFSLPLLVMLSSLKTVRDERQPSVKCYTH